MNITFCIITNRPERVKIFAATAHNAVVREHCRYSFLFSAEGDLTRYPFDDLKELGDVKYFYRKTEPGRFRWAQYRYDISNRVKDADYIIWADDDFRFSVDKSGRSAGFRYLEAFQYMNENPDCGIVYMKSYLGGSQAGRSFLPMPSGYYETACGIIIRAGAFPYFGKEYLQLSGTGEEGALAVTALEHGYYPAKGFNCPTNKDWTKKITARRGSKNFQTNSTYDIDHIREHGIFSVHIRKYGEWKFGGRLPPKLLELYRDRTRKLGFEPRM